jgi:pyochelin biosynthetic protein PchC
MVQVRDPGWIRALSRVADPATRLVCLPHSGGSVDTYRSWSAAMPSDTELLAVQYPGRSDQLPGARPGGIAEMGTHLAAELLRRGADDRTGHALFGHGLGALVAYETALAMHDRGTPPIALLLSGSAAPGDPHDDLPDRSTGDRELWAAMCALGGIDPAIAENAGLRELLLPALRSDMHAARTYRPSPGARLLPCPVRCYYSSGDPLTQGADMTAWAARTTGPFSMKERLGGHFHLWTDTAGLVRDILSTLPRRALLTV